MTISDKWPLEGNDHILPFLPSCFVLRPERFGAIFYNPFFGYEVELDPVEAFAMRMCDGRNSCRQVEQAVTDRFGLPPELSRSRIVQAVDRVSRMGGVLLQDGDEPVLPHIPDTVYFPEHGPILSAPKNVIWDLTYQCQLRCVHCLTSSGERRRGELDTKSAIKLIQTMAEAKVFCLSFSGGEPFLREDLVDLIHAGAQTNMRVDLATNGVGIPAEKIRALRDLPVFQVQISIDGPEEIHDRLRGRKGAFAAARQSVASFREEGIAVGLNTTVSKANLGALDALIDLALAWGCTGYKAIPFLPAGRGQQSAAWLEMDPSEHLRFARTIVARQRELAGRLSVTAEATFPFLLDTVPSTLHSRRMMGCSAGYDTLSVGADGTAYPCPFLHDFPLGHVLNQPVRELWGGASELVRLRGLSREDFHGSCRECEFAGSLCGGGCRASAYLHSGDLLGADPGCFRDCL
jgi:radical SAM protein with 4Fe4S-binding SPASM domain